MPWEIKIRAPGVYNSNSTNDERSPKSRETSSFGKPFEFFCRVRSAMIYCCLVVNENNFINIKFSANQNRNLQKMLFRKVLRENVAQQV